MKLQSISKPKLPRGRSYVLKTSVLENTLSQANIDCNMYLDYSEWDTCILRARYYCPQYRDAE